MKLFSAVLFAVSAHQGLSAKVASKLALQSIHETHDRSEADSFCPQGVTNKYPDTMPKTYTFGEVGLNPGNEAFDKTLLRAALAEDSDWVVNGVQWILQAKFTSNSNVAREFGFAGGNVDENGGRFMTITVPSNAVNPVVNLTIGAENNVPLTPASNVEFQYIGPGVWTSGVVTMTDICFAPMTCALYETCPVGTRKVTDSKIGDHQDTCCEARMCKDEVTCEPSSKYEQKDNFAEHQGHDKDSCCIRKFCPANGTCVPESKYDKKTNGTGLLGSTKDECCVPKTCDIYQCQPQLWEKKNGSAEIYGSTDDECCDPIHCSVFDCPGSGKFVLKENAETMNGSSTVECCDPKLCQSFNCGDETVSVRNASATQGNTSEECCIKLTCADYLSKDGNKCQSDKLHPKFEEVVGSRAGSTDEQCCDPLTCREYFNQTLDRGKCAQPLMFVPLQLVYAENNTDRIGFSDEDCCSKKMCTSNLCDPGTMWEPKASLATIQGSTQVQCCEPVYCTNFTCDTDDDGDGIGTQWIKKRDTNHYRFQGSTDLECCSPQYCSQYTTDNPRLFKRKTSLNGTVIMGLLGSTDLECYDQVMCSDHCCTDENKALRANAHLFSGASDAECCVLKTSLA